MARVFAGHRHKAVASVAHFFADPQSGNQIRRLLGVDLVVGIGTVNLEHMRSFRSPIIVVVVVVVADHVVVELPEREYKSPAPHGNRALRW
jgi:uncharacterized membrane protein YoaK (UPF0700 family)